MYELVERSAKKGLIYYQTYCCLMGRMMGLEPTNDRFTAGCVSLFTTFAMCA